MAVLPLSSLLVGYRFRPTDEELVNYFLKNKINGNENEVNRIREVDLCKKEPWDLPAMSLIETNDDEWVFFCPIDRKYRMGKRSNRATPEGFWKATGKDRLIKAVRGTTVIGTKKTLVFYTGRAPGGEKTNWVIHEYRSTSEQLDGTKPGQGLFVLCKLMKKCRKKLDGMQDENTEVSNVEELKQNDASPATVQSFPVDIKSPMTPLSNAQDEKLPSDSEGSIPLRFDRTPPGAPLPIGWPNDSCIADDVGCQSVVDPDLEIEDMLHRLFPGPTMESPHGDGKILSLLHSQVQVELGSSYDSQYPLASEVGTDQNGMQLPHETNEDEINQFLESAIISTDEYFCNDPESYQNCDFESLVSNYCNLIESTSVSYKELDAEVAKNNESNAPVPVEMYTRGYRTPDISNEENLRSLSLPENKSTGRHIVTVASTSDQSVDLFNIPEDYTNNSSAVGSGQVFETGIRIRSRRELNAVLPLSSLPVGYRFRPTDEELVNYFLKNKINGNENEVNRIREVDLCKKEPWDLPAMSLIETNDDEWVFFCPIDRKYRMGKRSNRATPEGFWKATGKDRLIKAVRGTTVIGTKKTLVFYTGRAPVGEKTNWVIHEYRSTSEQLDGTKPGQGLFVLCKLMKKCRKKLDGMQDENTEVSNVEELKQNDASPATVQSFPVDIESPMTPLSNAQDEKLPSDSEGSIPLRFDRTPPGAPLPIGWPNDSCIADDVGGQSVVEPDLEIEDMLHRLFPGPTMESPDGDGKILSLLHSQVQVELGSSYDSQYPLASEVGTDQNGMQLPHETNEDEINQFLESAIISTDEYFCNDPESYQNCDFESLVSNYCNQIESTSVSYKELDAEVAKNNESNAPVPVEMYTRGYRTPDISNEENLRSLSLPENKSTGRHIVTVASTSDQSVDLFNIPEDYTNNSSAVGSGQVFETGIRIRSRRSYDQPNVEFFEQQGNARRRIRLQQKIQVEPVQQVGTFELQSAKVEEAEEKHSGIIDETRKIYLSTSNDVTEVAEEPVSNTISTSVFPHGCDKEVPSVPLEAPPPLHLILSSIHKAYALVFVSLSIVFVGIWSCLKFQS